MKGVAGSLGGDSLYTLSQELQTALEAEGGECSALLDRFHVELQEFTQALNGYLAENS